MRSMGKSWYQSPIKSAAGRILCFWSGTKIIVIEANGYPSLTVFDPSTGEVRSDEPDNIACWFIDSDYNGESFFMRQAYFLGQKDPYKSLKTSLKVEIDPEAWESLNSDVSVPFAKPSTGRIAVKVIKWAACPSR